MGAGGVSSAGVGFRPESAPTVLDMSPEGSVLSRPPSVAGRDEEHMGGHFVNSNGDENGKNARYVCFFAESSPQGFQHQSFSILTKLLLCVSCYVAM